MKSKRSYSLVALCLVAHLLGCSQITEIVPRITKPAFEPRSEAKSDQLLEYLAAADAALARDHLSRPKRNSAFELYRNALVLDPENVHAHNGVVLILRRYMALANAALSQGNFERALTLLARAQSLDANNRDVIQMRQALVQQEQLSLNGERPIVVKLSVKELESRDPALVQRLQALALSLADSGERIVIYARTDIESRWLYQQLKQAQPNHHFVVTTGLSSRPRIVRVPVVRES
ncbi:tetratricopeptide repeat protein [Simiduia curdlanivorans]|uniref:Tetratricopeptide repeat protein n=1 Tax=Simiduia curdlanivorans TaxID=1492769 RepID=A0ABV8V3K8_9GAMM|nr:tetratricopeptide repeat protein [Simiduia curdlanivorans]MDN3638364.1 tetratricopeptide repeat protein [Simiduia curdlanivorans]